jgi:Mrp family chromosome partitioning ATPase
VRPATCPIIAELSAVQASVVHPVAIVSPGSATGRTTLAVNVAAAPVRAGIKVLLVSSSAGIIDIQALDALGWNLGQTDSSGNPAAVPTAQRCGHLIDVVIFDTDPCDGSTLAYTAASMADWTVISVMTNRTPMADFETTREQLQAVGAGVLAVAVNAEAQVLVGAS